MQTQTAIIASTPTATARCVGADVSAVEYMLGVLEAPRNSERPLFLLAQQASGFLDMLVWFES